MLSTPPAFILSQDQTLVKSVCPVQNNSGHFKPLDCFLQSVLLFFGNLHFWRCSLKIYKKFSGMVYDSVFNVLLSCRQSLIDDLHTIRCFFFLLLSATFISYHRFKCLSITFLFIFVVKLSLSNNSYMIPCIFSVVNNFFYFLLFGSNDNLHYQATIIFPLINSRSQRQLVYNNT